MSHEFDGYCKTNGIQRHMTAPYSPQQNGVVERRNRTLLEMTRSLLKHMSVPNMLWGEAVRHATYLLNRVATRSLQGQTPYEALRNKKPNVAHLKVFGCICYARTEKAGRKKLDDRSRLLVHLGTEPGSKAYRLFDPVSKRIVVSRDVHFDEEKQWNWNDNVGDKETEQGSFDVELTPSGNSYDYSEEQPTDDIENDEEEAIDDDGEGDEEEQPELRRSNRASKKPSYLDDYILMAEVDCERLLMVFNNEPWSYNEAKELKSLGRCMRRGAKFDREKYHLGPS